uniref:Uncharacterized protein n=1 Tax=Cucumis melo TaxID=3656 RepID=A0A9I9EG27_CUCME
MNTESLVAAADELVAVACDRAYGRRWRLSIEQTKGDGLQLRREIGREKRLGF